MTERLHRPWSISQLHTYENCAYQHHMKYDLKIPEPERPLPKGKTEHANDRGSRIHQGLEDYVRSDVLMMPDEAHDFAEDIDALREMYPQGSVMLEHDWCFDADWLPCAREVRDCIMIVDFAVWIVPDKWLLIGDYKSGRQYPVKHMDQMQGYALGAYRKFPQLEQVTTELWYLDQNDISSSTFKPRAADAIQNTIGRRVERMRTDTEHKPASHQYACRYCPYKDTCEFFESGVAVKGKPQSVIANSWATQWKI